MPRTKGSKNKPKPVTADFVTQIAEKQSAKEALTAEIACISIFYRVLNSGGHAAQFCRNGCSISAVAVRNLERNTNFN